MVLGRFFSSNKFTFNKFTVVAIISLFVICFLLIEKKMKDDAQSEIKKSLETLLATSQQALHSWQGTILNTTKVWANSELIKEAANALTQMERENLKSSKWQLKINNYLRSILNSYDFRGFFIINRELINVSSSRKSNINVVSLLNKQKNFFDRIWLGQTVSSELIKSDVPLEGSFQVSLFSGAPIRNKHGEIIAAFCFRVDPSLNFSKILSRGRMGKTGETYAINKRGMLASESRFVNQLERINLLKKDQDAILNIKIINPEVNLLTANHLEKRLKKSKKSLTYMAERVLFSKERFNVQTNLLGYRDYRGVFVVGAWVWDFILGIGIATEIDLDEAYYSFRQNRNIIMFLMILMCLLILVLSYLIDSNNKWLKGIINSKTEELRQEISLKELMGKKLEKTLKKIEKGQEKLLQAEKLASIGELAAGVGHEINNPLGIASGYIHILKKELEKTKVNQKSADIISRIENSHERIKNIVSGLRIYSRDSGEEIEILNCNKILMGSLELIQGIYKQKGITLTLETSKEPPFISGNRGKMQQVIMNFLSNSKDSLENIKREKKINIKVFRVGNSVKMTFQDTGKGIEEKNLKKIFYSFFTTKGPDRGTGLGMSISHSIIKSMNGEISVISELNIGTTFTLTFPYVEKKPNEVVLKSDLVPHNRPNITPQFLGKVLIVEDEEAIREILTDMLESFGLEVESAENGQMALDKVVRAHDAYQVILTDMQMPVMDGLELINKLRNLEGFNTKIIVVTGGPKNLSEGIDLSDLADGLLEKPFSEKELADTLSALFSQTTGKKKCS